MKNSHMKILKLFIAVFIIVALLLSTFALPLSKASDKNYNNATNLAATTTPKPTAKPSPTPTPDPIEGEHEVVTENLGFKYYEFKNPLQVTSNNDYIAVLEGKVGEGKGAVVMFDSKGNYLSRTVFNDPRKVVLTYNNAIVLDFDIAKDKTSLIGLLSSSGTTVPMAADQMIYDIAAVGGSLYVATIGISRKLIRYNLTSEPLGITLDKNFTCPSELFGISTIASNHTNIIATKVVGDKTSIMYYNTVNDSIFTFDNLPSGQIKNLSIDAENVYALTSNGIYASEIRKDAVFNKILSIDTSGDITDRNIVSPIAIDVYRDTSTSKMTVIDGGLANSMKRYSVTVNSSSFDNVYVCSSTANVEGFNTPTDMSMANDRTYFADSKNNRISIVERTGKRVVFDTVDSDGNKITPKHVAADASGNIFVASSNRLYVYDKTGRYLDMFSDAEDKKFSNITAITTTSVDGSCYIIDNNRLVKYDADSKSLKVLRSAAMASNTITIDIRLQRIIIATSESVIVYDEQGMSRVQSVVLSDGVTIRDVKVDFEGSIYALCSENGNTFIAKARYDGSKYRSFGKIDIKSDSTFMRMAFDVDRRTFYLLPNEHRYFTLDSDALYSLKVAKFSDQVIPIDIFDKGANDESFVARFTQTSNRLLYPLSAKDALYPVNFALTKLIKAPQESFVVVCGYTKDGKFAYVLYNQSAGFVDANAVTKIDLLTQVPFKVGITLHENSYVYKYPLITQSNLLPLYSIDKLKKDTEVKLQNKVGDFISPTGLMWYFVEYQDANGNAKEGYIPRYNVADKAKAVDGDVEYGRISAKLLEGYVDVFADEGSNKIGKVLLDGTKVEILFKTKDFAYVREVSPKDEMAAEGYVRVSQITSDAQTSSQNIAIIIIAVVLIAVLVLVIFKLRRRRY